MYYSLPSSALVPWNHIKFLNISSIKFTQTDRFHKHSGLNITVLGAENDGWKQFEGYPAATNCRQNNPLCWQGWRRQDIIRRILFRGGQYRHPQKDGRRCLEHLTLNLDDIARNSCSNEGPIWIGINKESLEFIVTDVILLHITL